MKHYTETEIIEKMTEIFSDEFRHYAEPEIKVEFNSEELVIVSIEQMYEYVSINLSHLIKVANFFDTMKINDSRYAAGGCETCDYGSSYKITLTIEPN